MQRSEGTCHKFLQLPLVALAEEAMRGVDCRLPQRIQLPACSEITRSRRLPKDPPLLRARTQLLLQTPSCHGHEHLVDILEVRQAELGDERARAHD